MQYEADALARNPRMTVLPGRKPLEQAVAAWRLEHPDATVETVLSKAYSRCKSAHSAPAETIEVLIAPEDPPDRLLPMVQARVLLLHHIGGHPHDP